MRRYETKETFWVESSEYDPSDDGEEFTVSRVTNAEYFNPHNEYWDGTPEISWDGYYCTWKYEDGRWFAKKDNITLGNAEWTPCEEPEYEKMYRELYDK